MNLLLFKRTLALKQRKTFLLHTGFASKTVCAFVILFAVLLVTSPFISLAAEKPNTLVLPFNINTTFNEAAEILQRDVMVFAGVVEPPVGVLFYRSDFASHDYRLCLTHVLAAVHRNIGASDKAGTLG